MGNMSLPFRRCRYKLFISLILLARLVHGGPQGLSARQVQGDGQVQGNGISQGGGQVQGSGISQGGGQVQGSGISQGGGQVQGNGIAQGNPQAQSSGIAQGGGQVQGGSQGQGGGQAQGSGQSGNCKVCTLKLSVSSASFQPFRKNLMAMVVSFTLLLAPRGDEYSLSRYTSSTVLGYTSIRTESVSCPIFLGCDDILIVSSIFPSVYALFFSVTISNECGSTATYPTSTASFHPDALSTLHHNHHPQAFNLADLPCGPPNVELAPGVRYLPSFAWNKELFFKQNPEPEGCSTIAGRPGWRDPPIALVSASGPLAAPTAGALPRARLRREPATAHVAPWIPGATITAT